MKRITTEMDLIRVREERDSNINLLQYSYNKVFDRLQEIEVNSENGLNFVLPFEVGAMITSNESTIKHIDFVSQYLVKKDGLYVIVSLCGSQLSKPIKLDEFLNRWTIATD